MANVGAGGYYQIWSAKNSARQSNGGTDFTTATSLTGRNTPSMNFRIFWDGDLYDNLLDGANITDWNGRNMSNISVSYTHLDVYKRQNIFKLKYFDKDAYLAQSPQFYKQTCVAFFDRVFEIAPVYRAEKHNSTRHLNEYIGLDFEMGFINDMHDVMAMETAMLKYVVEYLPKHYSDELELLGATLPVINEIPSVTFFEALDILGKSHNQFDLDPTDEVKLCEYAKENYDSEFIFVEKFPGLKRPFYAMDSADDPKLAESFDLLFRGLEITTGGQRIHAVSYTHLTQRKHRKLSTVATAVHLRDCLFRLKITYVHSVSRQPVHHICLMTSFLRITQR